MVSYDGKYYMCDICKLHYAKKEDAEMCEKWCSTHNACNLEITRRSIERSGQH
ncbi:MAG: hypothetical protein ACP5K9_03010 [Candidatus Micrarchaeia archaeon]